MEDTSKHSSFTKLCLAVVCLLVAVCLLVYAGFLHFGELVHLRSCDVHIGYLILKLDINWSKIDQLHKRDVL